MPEPEAVTTVVSASPAPEQGAPQATEQPAQASVQPQGTPVQVENGTRQQLGNEVRPFERIAGRKFDKIEKGMQSIMEALQNMQKPTTSPSATAPITAEDFLTDPLAHLNRLLDERDKKLKGEIPQTLSEQTRNMELLRSQKEALKMIETNETISKDPEGWNRVEDILNDEEFGLKEIASYNPLSAARLALRIYSEKYGKAAPSASAPSKAQMASTATAVHPSGKVTLKDEAVELQKQLLGNPELRYDREFMKKLQSLKDRRQAELNS